MPYARGSVSLLFIVYVALLVLVGLTVEAARHDLGRWNFAVAMAIAAVKTVLVMIFFMHVLRTFKVTRLVVCAGFFGLAILFTLSLADYWTRDWLFFISD